MEEKINTGKDGSSLKCNTKITSEPKNAKDSSPLGPSKEDNLNQPNPYVVNSCKSSATYCAGANHLPVRIRQVISGELNDDSEKNYPCSHLALSSWRPGSPSACIECGRRDAESQNQIIADDDCRTKGKLDNDNKASVSFSTSMENKRINDSVPGIMNDYSKEIDWESYRNFLFNVWEENSLSNSSLDSESSTLPSLSSISGEFPYALNILTMEKLPSSPNNNDSQLSTKEVSQKTTMESKYWKSNAQLSQETPLESKYCESNTQCKCRSCTIPIENYNLDSELEKPRRPRPLANKLKESSSISQGSASRSPAQMLRSQTHHQPLQHSESSLSQPYKKGQIPWKHFRGNTSPQHRQQRREQPPPPQRHQEQKLLPKFFVLESECPDKYSGKSLPRSCCDKYCTNKGHTPDHNWKFVGQPNLREKTDEISELQKEIELAQNRIMTLSQQMEDQSSRLQLLIGARNRNALGDPPEPFQEIAPNQPDPRMTYPVLPQGYKAPHHGICSPGMGAYGYGHPALNRRASCQYPCEAPGGRVPAGLPEDLLMSQLTGTVPRELENLRDRIVALQMQNIELNLFLKKEELKRKEAENAVKKEKEYVKKLQNSLQDLSTSTLVMDPLTYKQVADKYIASRKKAVRRTHTCNPAFLGSSDLVCDSNKLDVSKNAMQSTSCPSSPLGSNQDRRTTSTRTTPAEAAYSRHKEDTRLHQESTNWEEGMPGSPPLSPQDYNSVLHSLEGLQLSSSPS